MAPKVIKRITKRTQKRRRAATADVVGVSKPTLGRISSKWRKHHDRLMELRTVLLNRRVDLARDATEEPTSFSLHMADAGTDSYDRDFALSRMSSEQNALYEIEQALIRIRSRTYGTCELTGKPIEPNRLEAIPWTRFSLEAERRLEKEGVVRRAQLAPRESMTRSTASGSEAEGGNDERE
jgi:DnaK suppressor protein